MKKIFNLVIILAAIIGFSLVVTRTPKAHAQDVAPQQAVVPVAARTAAPQYKVVDIGQISIARGRTPAETLEALLNELGARGWRVVATAGTLVILSN